MTNLAGSSAKNSFHWIPPDSTGFHRIPLDSTGFHWIPPDSTGMTGFQQESQGQGKDLYLHYCSLSRSLRRIEENLLATQLDLDQVFEDMTRNNFDDAFAFFVARRQRERNPLPPRPPSISLPSFPRIRRVPLRTWRAPSSHRTSESESDTSISPPATSFHTARSATSSPDPNDIVVIPWGEEGHPIDVDRCPPSFTQTQLGSRTNPVDVEGYSTPSTDREEHYDTPVPQVGILHRQPRRRRQRPCSRCRRTTHTTEDCNWYGIPRRRQ
jgi:hypothetical protein